MPRTTSGASLPCTCEHDKISPCKCRSDTASGYIRALTRTNVWPLEDTWNKYPAEKILERLEDFKFTRQSPKCSYWDGDYNRLVNYVAEKVRKYCGGLCLDCMSNSRDSVSKQTHYASRFGSDEMDHDAYWNHNTYKTWGKGCRVKHDEPTWYFSFMGRRQND